MLSGSRVEQSNHFDIRAPVIVFSYSYFKGTTLQDSYLLVNVFLRADTNDFSKLQIRVRYAPFPKRFLRKIGNVLQTRTTWQELRFKD